MKNILLTLALLTLAMGHGQTKNEMKPFDARFVHNVYFWLKNPDSPDDRKAFETSLQKFLHASAYAKTHFIGKPPKATREVVDGSFTYSMTVTFESAEAQQNYQTEPPHLLFIEESSKLWTKVLVYDSIGIEH